MKELLGLLGPRGTREGRAEARHGARPVSVLPRILSLSVLVLPAMAAHADCLPGLCNGDLPFTAEVCGLDEPVCEEGSSTNPSDCTGSGCNFVNNCRTPTVEGPFFDVLPEGGDSFTVQAGFEVRAPWNHWASEENPAGALDMFWYQGPSSSICQQSTITLCQYTASDDARCYLEQTGLSCSGAPYDFGTIFFRAEVCGGGCFCEQNPTFCSCWRRVDRTLDFVVTAEILGCPVPRVDDCEADCTSCQPVGGGCSFSRGGDAPVCTPPGGGPGTLLRYAGGGVGAAGLPGSSAWNVALGRYWAHDYAQKIIEDPDPDRVLLATNTATFRVFSNPDAFGVYQDVSPSDEHRRLTHTGSGWELEELDGTVHHFGVAGDWLQSVDRNGNAKVATYTSGVLTSVSLPDGRREDFGYHPGGKLATITEVGVGEGDSRTWSYTWAGDDLVSIDRPDARAWLLLYEDSRHPGFLTEMVLVGTDANERVEAAFEYDQEGNVVRSWRGEVASGPNGPVPGPNAVEIWSQSFDDPVLPETTEVTDPLGKVVTFTLARDTVSSKIKVLSISGDCPVCDLGPNSQLFYEDTTHPHPLLPTRIVDALGVETLLEYDADGQLISRVEALGEPEQRTTLWTYDATFPALVTSMEVPSVAGGAAVRRTEWLLDGSGNAIERTISGIEAGAGFSLTTETTFNAAGQPEVIDPPGFGTDDQTSFTYDSARGDLVATSRTDPLVGTTTFGLDPFNRRVSVTDPNGVETSTTYDELDRVTEVRQVGASPPGDDLVTNTSYSVFGDLLRTTLPEGNVIEYDYDAAGRLISVERKPDAATSGERVFYQLDDAGNRILEELQRWDPVASAWETMAATAFEYASRCHLERVIQAPGTPEEAATTYEHDCKGNISAVWDPAHDPATDPPSTSYTYDSLDRLLSVSQPWAGGGNAVTSFVYDDQDHLIAVTDPEGNTTSYEYSDRDLLTKEVSPVSGTTTHAYNSHGELLSTTDARPVTVTRTVDALGRVSFVDYGDPSLDTAYTWDTQPAACTGASFPVGRLGSITRGGESVDHCYDRFGRLTRDGELLYSYDANGNRVTIDYPGGVSASYTHDFADREITLTVTAPGGVEAVVTGAAYLPSGPLSTLPLGSGTTEARGFDGRYLPASITLSGATERAWSFQTDPVGNVLEIVELAGCEPVPLVLENQTVTTTELFASCSTIEAGNDFRIEGPGDVTFLAEGVIALGDGFSVGEGARFTAGSGSLELSRRSYTYQAPQSFLTSATGPWGELAWSYDRIGNRTSETRDGGAPDLYQYVLNPGSGNTPILDYVALGVMGTREYSWGAAGHLEEIAAGANVIELDIDAEGRLALTTQTAAGASAVFSYDGRSFLREAEDPATSESVRPVYASDGLLMALLDGAGSSSSLETYSASVESLFSQRSASSPPPIDLMSSALNRYLLYFAGRPVAILASDGFADTYTYLATDHLGSPMLATDSAGQLVWEGGFEPFGRDWQAGTGAGASENGVFLRLPGQWVDTTWEDATLGAELFYNVHRWYEPQTGRYTRADPLQSSHNDYGYVEARPTFFVDPLGLMALDPVSCGPMRRRRMTDRVFGQDDLLDLGCCYEQLERAVRKFNEFFSRGWRQRNPDCWRAIDSMRMQGWRPRRPGQGTLSPLSCMIAGHRGKTMMCESKGVPGAPRGTGCGRTDPSGQTYFRPDICDQQKCLSPLNILFHEALHSCGAPPDSQSDAARTIATRCVGQ